MRKMTIIILVAFIFVCSMGVGYFYLNTRTDQKNTSKIEENEITNDVNDKYIATQTQEEKISPNAKLAMTIYYGKCGHAVNSEINVPKEVVNMDEDELMERYTDWKVNYFSSKEIAIYKEMDGTCPEHYIVGTSDGVINIYKVNEEGEEELYETTSICIEYLPKKDQEKLENKIEVIGKENLNSLLENYD